MLTVIVKSSEERGWCEPVPAAGQVLLEVDAVGVTLSRTPFS
ncbi:hypothetical protein [Pseudonocardia sp. MH-G8]|nr:hypothetical protein [Pseudonocardia sp. MH-G8]